MAQTPTAFDTTVLVDLDSDNGMKYKMPRHCTDPTLHGLQ